MEILQNIFQAQIFQILGWTLVHFVWQGLAIGLILAIVLKALHKSSANLRYIIACIALVLVVLVPAITIRTIGVPVEAVDQLKLQALSPEIIANTEAVVEIPLAESPLMPSAAIPSPPLTDRLIERVNSSLPFIVTGWLIGVFGLSLWHLGGWTQLQRLRKQMTKPVTDPLKAKLKQLSNALGVKKTIALMESALVQVPTVVGHLKPVILLPASALTGLSTEQIEAILAHELAHIKRHDYLVNILQTVVEILGFYHPAVWWISRKIRLERENACDDIAVSLCADKLSYAKALTTMEQIRTTQPTLAIAASGGNLFKRIKRLLPKDQNQAKQTCLPSLITILLIAALLIPTALALSGGNKEQVSEKDDSGADAIVRKVLAKYSNMESYSAEGEVISDIDMSGVGVENMPLPGQTKESQKKLQENKEYQDALKKRHKLKHTFTIKLAKPNLYCVTWDQKIHENYSNTGAVWSSDGQEHFLFNARQKTSPKNRRMALASATGVSGGAANTIPSLFFAQQANGLGGLGQLQNVSKYDDEKIDSEQCYVISGQIAGMKVNFWISKKTLLIHQRQQILGGKTEMPELSDEEIKDFLQMSGQEVTPELIKQTKETMKQASAISSKIKGTITETHRNITVNQPVNKDDFIPDVNEGDSSSQTGLSPKFKNAGEWLKGLQKPSRSDKNSPLVMCEPDFDPNGEDRKLLQGRKAQTNQLSGIVVDDNGKPIENVLVDVWTWYRGKETRTDKNGYFKLEKFDPDQKTVEIRFSKKNFTPRYIIKQPVGLKDTTVVLNNKTYFEGTVTDSKGQPVSNAKIRANPGPKHAEGVTIGEIWTETKSDNNGKYRLYAQADSYDMQIKAKEGVLRLPKVKIEKGQAKKLDLQLESSVTFYANIIDAHTGEPVKGFRLHGWKKPGMEGTSDSNGFIEIKGMLPGKFKFHVDAKHLGRWWSQDCISKWNHRRIDDEKAGWQRNFDGLDFDVRTEMKPVTIEVEKPAKITGKVIDPQGNAVEAATVTLARTGSGNSITGDTRYSFKTDKNGNFEMIVPASNQAQYNLIAHDGKYNKWRIWANAVLPPIRTKPGELIEDIVITLNKPATVKGKVVDESGNPVPKLKVRSHAFDKMGNRYYDPSSRTDKNGNFKIKFIRPGKHYIQADPFWLTAEQAPEGSSRIVTVQEGEVINDIKLTIHKNPGRMGLKTNTKANISSQKAMVQGHVLDPDGKPIANAEVQIREKRKPGQKSIAAPDVVTDANGYYSLDENEIKWPYSVGALWYQDLPNSKSQRHQYKSRNKYFEINQTVDFKFEKFPTGNSTLSGQITDENGKAIKVFTVDVRNKVDWKDYSEDFLYQYGYKMSFSTQDGKFYIGNLPAGEFTVYVHNPEPIDTNYIWPQAEIKLEEGKTKNIEMQSKAKKAENPDAQFEGKDTELITVAGQVVSFKTKKPIENALVRIAIPHTDMRSVRVSTDHKIIELKTDSMGKFSKKISFTDEKYISVDVLKAGYGTAAGTYRSGSDPLLAKIDLHGPASGYASNLKIKLQKALYIKGTVVDKNNNPVSGVKVSGQIRTKRSAGGISQTQTDEQGTFELFDFPPTVNENETGRLTFTHPEYEKVTVSDIYEKNTSQLTSYRIVIPKGLTVKGKVLDSNGKPAGGLTVEAQTGKYGLFLRNTVTDSKGHFEITGLKKQNKIIVMSSTPDFGHKASQVLSPFNDSKDIILTLSPFKSAGPKTHSFLNMKVADVTPALRDKFDIPKKMNGVAILDPGSNSDRLDIGDLKTGYYFWMTGNKRIKNLKEMVTEILRIHAKPKPISGGMITEGYEGMIRIVYGKRKGTNTTYLKLTEKGARQLRELGKKLGIDKVFLNSESLKKKVKNDLINQFNKSLDKTISVSIKASPPMEDKHLTLQYAAGAISHHAGIPFNSTTTMELARSKWRKQIEPLEIKEKTAKEALAQLLNPEGLTYKIDEYGLHLIPIENSDKKQEGDGDIITEQKTNSQDAVLKEYSGWEKRFHEIYRLEDDQILKRIAPPFIPERLEFYNHEESSQAATIPKPPDYFTFHWESSKIKRWGLGFTGGKRSLDSVLRQNLSIESNKFDGPKKLLKIQVPGDWVIRMPSTIEKRLKSLEKILSEEIGRDIRFEKRQLGENVLIVTGAFKFHPPSETYENKSVHLFTDELDPDEGSGGGTADSVNDFLGKLGDLIDITVIDQTSKSSEEIKIPYRHHSSSYLRKVKGEAEKKRKLDMLLPSLTKQTELQFRIARRPVEVWFVTEKKDGKTDR